MSSTPRSIRRIVVPSSRLILGLALAGPVLVMAQPEGKGKPAHADKAARPETPSPAPAMPAQSKGKGKDAAPVDEASAERARGFDAVAAKKAEQERKELGKGSEQGQLKREENSRKWWKFWGNKKDPVPPAPPAPTPPPAP